MHHILTTNRTPGDTSSDATGPGRGRGGAKPEHPRSAREHVPATDTPAHVAAPDVADVADVGRQERERERRERWEVRRQEARAAWQARPHSRLDRQELQEAITREQDRVRRLDQRLQMLTDHTTQYPIGYAAAGLLYAARFATAGLVLGAAYPLVRGATGIAKGLGLFVALAGLRCA